MNKNKNWETWHIKSNFNYGVLWKGKDSQVYLEQTAGIYRIRKKQKIVHIDSLIGALDYYLSIEATADIS